MTAVWLLPVVTLVVASSTGGLVAKALLPHSAQFALLTATFSFVMVIIGLSFALMFITIYALRLVAYGPPDISLILSSFIVLGELRALTERTLLLTVAQDHLDRVVTHFC